MLRATGILLKKEAHAFFSSFTRKQRTPDVAGKLLSFLLAAAIVAFGCFALKRFADMYLTIEVGRVSDPYARLYELTAVIYTVIIAVNALGAVRVINRSVFESDDLRILLTLPLPSGAVWLSKMAAAYAKQFVFGLFTVLPVNVTLGVCVPLGAQFYGMTALILVLLPMISLGVGSVLALPVHAVARLISSRYVVTLVVVTAVTAVAFWLYSAVLDFIANLISTGEARYFFDAETMRGIARAVSRMYPAAFFSDMLLTDGMPAAVGWVILIAAVLSALSVLAGRLMLLPAAQDRLFALNGRYVWKGRSLPAPQPRFLSFMKKSSCSCCALRPMPSDTFPRR